MPRVVILVAALLAAAPALADPICTDRPGKGSAPCTAPAGHLQVETAIADWIRDDGETTLSIGQTAIKYGLTDRSQIELDVTPFERVGGRSGFGDTYLRYKHRLTAEDAPVEVALYPYVKLPTARHGIGNGKVEAGLVVPISHDIEGTPFSISTSPEGDWLADEDGRGHHVAMVQVASLNFDVGERLTLTGELWGQWDWDPSGTERQLSADAAAAYLANDDLQFDAGANFGLNKVTPDVELHVGVSKRF